MSAPILSLFSHLVFTYFSGLYLHGFVDDIQRVITLVISELAILVAVQLLLNGA